MKRMHTFAELPFERKVRLAALIIGEAGMLIAILYFAFLLIKGIWG